jgi:hypothetical protein
MTPQPTKYIFSKTPDFNVDEFQIIFLMPLQHKTIPCLNPHKNKEKRSRKDR